jgi:hypothetical protein
MAVFTKTTLSGSTDGRGILVTATASAGTLIHTGSSTATTLDEIYLYVQNTSASIVKLTVQWGGTTSPNDEIEVSVAAEAGLMLVVPALIIKGNATPLVVRAFAATGSVLVIHGYVNRIA